MASTSRGASIHRESERDCLKSLEDGRYRGSRERPTASFSGHLDSVYRPDHGRDVAQTPFQTVSEGKFSETSCRFWGFSETGLPASPKFSEAGCLDQCHQRLTATTSKWSEGIMSVASPEVFQCSRSSSR